MLKKPVIGLTSDCSSDKKYSDFPYLALRFNYSLSLQRAGAIPILLPPIQENYKEYIELLDGIVITGGNFDIHPKLYGESTIHDSVSVNEQRTNFEKNIAEEAIKHKMPILGICGGMQLLNVIFGGNLIQHIPDHDKNYFNHEAKPYDSVAHEVSLKEGSLLHKIAGDKKIGVNSSHHQAILKTAPDFIISAISDDGIIEAIENPNYPFMLGVQWHPEYEITEADSNIFKTFVGHCANK